MAVDPRGRRGRPWRRAAQRLRDQHNPCAICGRPIRYDAPPLHPEAFSVDHKIPLALGGHPLDPSNLQAAHRVCNSRKGDGRRGTRRWGTNLDTTRRW